MYFDFTLTAFRNYYEYRNIFQISWITIIAVFFSGECVAYLQQISKAVNCFRKKVAGLSRATLLNKKLQHSWLQVISSGNNLFEDIPAMSLRHNKSLITCNSHNDKLIWKWIHLPRCCFEQNLVEVYFHIFIFFN